MTWLSSITRWFGALTERTGEQRGTPSGNLVPDSTQIGPDAALQLDTVWACIDRRATTVASLPLFVYAAQANGMKSLARGDRLYQLLHDSPNTRMTPFDFWRALIMNYDLRGNAYARIDRDETTGEALALWPMPADQVRPYVLDDGAMVYEYRIDSDVAVLAAANVLHVRGLGNGTIGLSKLEFMRAGLDEASKAQGNATRVFGNSGKPTGVLMTDRTLSADQRRLIHKEFGDLAQGSMSRLAVLEANLKYEPISFTPEDQQLLETRKFSVEQLCRWFDVPPVLVHHSEGVTYNGAEQVIDAWHKLGIRPLLVGIEQALRKQVMTPRQRASMSAEFSHDALLRGSLKDRLAAYAQATQNGIYTRAECRQLENLPPLPGSDVLTAQSNLVPLPMLGKVTSTAPTGGSNAPAQDPIAQ